MLNQRRRAADTVACDFRNVETATDEAARLAAVCLATMLQQRTEAKLPVDTGLEALQLVSEAAAGLVVARQRLVQAHKALVDVRDGIGLGAFYGYGDESECPPIKPFVEASAPRLAAVA